MSSTTLQWMSKQIYLDSYLEENERNSTIPKFCIWSSQTYKKRQDGLKGLNEAQFNHSVIDDTLSKVSSKGQFKRLWKDIITSIEMKPRTSGSTLPPKKKRTVLYSGKISFLRCYNFQRNSEWNQEWWRRRFCVTTVKY